MDPNKVTYFAETDSRNKKIRFGIKSKDRTRHVYVIGKTGMGKSTLLENMAIQDIQNGEGMAFIDPHGKTAELLLDYVPPERIRDVVYFAPFDLDHPISFNVMEDIGYDRRHLVVSGLMSTFKKIWVDAWSARMEYILSNTLLALIEYPGSTLLGVNRMLADKEYRKKVVDNVKDPAVKSFWVDEFAKYTDKFAAEATPAIQNKIGQFTANPLIRNIVGQEKSSFDIRKLMDERKILIINLSKGRVGETNATLLGSMLVTKIYLAAMSRADVTEKDLKNLPNFYLFVDEFQSFANESFANILSEARKYKLNLTITHQYIEQMPEEVRAAVFGNVGTMITFRVGAYDAEVLEKEFAPQFTAEDLVGLGFVQVYLKLMIDGISSAPFSATTLAPFPEPIISYRREIIESSRMQFSVSRQKVEEDINAWHTSGHDPKGGTAVKKDFAKEERREDRRPNGPVQSTAPQAPRQPVKPTIAPTSTPVTSPAPAPTPAPVAPARATVAPPVVKPAPIQAQPKPQVRVDRPIAERPVVADLPPIEPEEGDDFIPLKEVAKKIKPEPKPWDNSRAGKKPNDGKTMTQERLLDLKSVLSDVLNKKEEKNPEPQKAPAVKEVPEDVLKKVLE